MDLSEMAKALAASRPKAPATCERCGVAFETFIKHGARFCSGTCRQSAWAEKNRARERERLRAWRERRRAASSQEAAEG
jgi:predicted nucleic acid-binding Zn ribbon protein